MYGYVVLERYDREGRLVERKEGHNELMIDTGLKYLAEAVALYSSDSSDNIAKKFYYICFRDGDYNVLGNVAGSKSNPQSGQYQVVATYTNDTGSSKTVGTVELVDSSNTYMLAQRTDVNQTLNDGDSLRVTWTINFNA